MEISLIKAICKEHRSFPLQQGKKKKQTKKSFQTETQTNGISLEKLLQRHAWALINPHCDGLGRVWIASWGEQVLRHHCGEMCVWVGKQQTYADFPISQCNIYIYISEPFNFGSVAPNIGSMIRHNDRRLCSPASRAKRLSDGVGKGLPYPSPSPKLCNVPIYQTTLP